MHGEKLESLLHGMKYIMRQIYADFDDAKI